MPGSFPSFCTQPPEVTALLPLSLSTLPFLGQPESSIKICCFVQALIWILQNCFYALISFRDQWMIEGLSKAMSATMVWSNFSSFPSKISIHIKKWSDLPRPNICKPLKSFWLLNSVCITRAVASFPQASWQLQPTRKHTVFVLTCPTVQPAQTVPECCPGPQELSHNFSVKTFNYVLE